jgi:hypothetical protein
MMPLAVIDDKIHHVHSREVIHSNAEGGGLAEIDWGHGIIFTGHE